MCVDLANDEISKKKLQNHHFPYMYANPEQQFCLLGLTRTVADLKRSCPRIKTDFALSIRVSAVDAKGARGARACSQFGVQKGAKPDSCLSEFSYYIL